MTVLENLEMGAYIEGDPARIAANLERVYAIFPMLAERRKHGPQLLTDPEVKRLYLGG